MEKFHSAFQQFRNTEVLTRSQLRQVLGGVVEPPAGNSCNVYCGSGSHYTCTDTCKTCESAGNGQNPNVPGGDKLCVQ